VSNPWFRMYGETIHNTKLLCVTEALRWRYVALLCLHSNGDYLDTPDDEICIALRITDQEWAETKSAFIKRGLLNADGSIYGWEKRQYISDIKDPTAAERQKRYRDNKRNDRNASVTSRLPESDTDTDISTTTVVDKAKGKRAAIEKPDGVEEKVWDSFKVLRKTKRAPITQLAMDGIAREARLAGIDLNQALTLCCERSWQGFEAKWVKPNSSNQTGRQMTAAEKYVQQRDAMRANDERTITGSATRVA
jgi:hypothetical protein